jgi:phosphate acetyltransferase
MTKNSIFIGATGQNVGKTTLCLGLIAALKKRFDSVGFIKPVGQQHVRINDTNVDKDVVLFKEYFHLNEDWSDMSPVIIPPGFTRDFLDGHITEKQMQSDISHAFYKIKSQNSYTIVEGTGHIGVGSLVNMNNAKIAALLGLDMVLIASGGLGSAHDELALNIEMCKHYGAKVRGIILNRVLEEKREMILEYFPKSLHKWGIPLIGCVPYNAFLSNPTIRDFENLFSTDLLAGEEYRYCHFQNTRLVASSLEAYLAESVINELVITPASREDIILAAIKKHREKPEVKSDYCDGMILTSKQPPSSHILEEIKKVNIPVLYAPLCSYDVMKMITSFSAKIRSKDISKVQKAIALVEENLDFDLLCQPVPAT